ncbi:hypothetical protein D3C85_1897750 [compost metagenome]
MYHFTANTEHFAARFLSHLRIVKNEIRIAREPVTPLRLTRNILIKEIDVRPPYAVGAIHDGL